MKIHPTAIVDSGAELADDVEVQPYTLIGPQVRIGSGTVVGPHCVLAGRTVIGKNNRIFSGAQVGVVSQDMKHHPDLLGRVEIGDENYIREHVTISASTISSDEEDHRVTSIGNGCWLMAYSHVGHDCHLANQVIMANCASLAGHVEVADFANIGGLAGVHQECAIGTLCFVGGMSRISQDVPPFMIVEGNPARCHGPNSVGLRRRGFDEAARGRIKTMYRLMYRSNHNVTQALHEIEREVEESVERSTFVEFYRQTIRGVTR
jgi:UDP-N-acetylglucosamine acyltransferase